MLVMSSSISDPRKAKRRSQQTSRKTKKTLLPLGVDGWAKCVQVMLKINLLTVSLFLALCAEGFHSRNSDMMLSVILF